MPFRAAMIIVILAAITGVPAEDSLPHSLPAEIGTALANAVARTPGLIASRKRIEAARSRARAAGTLEDPAAALTYQNEGLDDLTLGTSGDAFVGISYSQPLPGPGKRNLRRTWASRSVESLASGLRRAEIDLRLEVERTWWALALERETLALLEERRAILREIESLIRTRYAAGQGIQQDILRAQAERTRAAESIAIRQGVLDGLMARLRSDLLLSEDAPLPEPGPLFLPPEPLPLDPVMARALRESPEIQAARSGAQADALRADIARADFRPDYTVGGTYMHRGSLDPMVAVSIGVRLPIFRSRVRSGLAAALDESAAGESDTEAITRLVVLRTRQRWYTIRAARESLGLLQEGVLPQDRLAYESALSSYRTGQSPATSVLAALLVVFQDRIEIAGRMFLVHAETAALQAVSLEAPADLSAMSTSGGMTPVAPSWMPSAAPARTSPNPPVEAGGSGASRMGGMP